MQKTIESAKVKLKGEQVTMPTSRRVLAIVAFAAVCVTSISAHAFRYNTCNGKADTLSGEATFVTSCWIDEEGMDFTDISAMAEQWNDVYGMENLGNSSPKPASTADAFMIS